MVSRVVGFWVFLFSLTTFAQQPDPPGQAKSGNVVHIAYLFAHMTHQDYGRLYYSASLDGLHWFNFKKILVNVEHKLLLS